MALFNSSNPTIKESIFTKEQVFDSSRVMTVNGTINKIGISLLILLVSASYTWGMFFEGIETGVMPNMKVWLYGGLIGGFVLALITMFNKKTSHITVPLYAIAEGLFLGALSAYFEAMYRGIVIQAVALTFTTFFMLLFAYKSRLVKVTQKFKSGVIAATGGIFLFYMATYILNIFGIGLGYSTGNSLMSIGISVFVVIIAALNLVLDFDMIEKGAKHRAPKYMEWYGAFGLLVTLVWLYLEILRLLAKLNSRD